MKTNSLIQPLVFDNLDIIGDIHGEIDALNRLLDHLGYSLNQPHNSNRKLAFIGDFCDRGPNSPEVIFRVKELVDSGQGIAILGNHEVNLLVDDAKDGSGWYFPNRYQSDLENYAPFKLASEYEKKLIYQFLNALPIAYENPQLRLIHAAWEPNAVEKIKPLPIGCIKSHHLECQRKIAFLAKETGLQKRYEETMEKWGPKLEDPTQSPPWLEAIAQYDQLEAQTNPIKIVTSGVETTAKQQFFSGNRWRYSDRLPWWNYYDGDPYVVIGHFWRLLQPEKHQEKSRYSQLFNKIPPLSWHGNNNKVFCVDYSVGARWRDRKHGISNENSRYHLAALQWPENTVVLDSGKRYPLSPLIRE